MFDLGDDEYDGQDVDPPFRAMVFKLYAAFLLALFGCSLAYAAHKSGWL